MGSIDHQYTYFCKVQQNKRVYIHIYTMNHQNNYTKQISYQAKTKEVRQIFVKEKLAALTLINYTILYDNTILAIN